PASGRGDRGFRPRSKRGSVLQGRGSGSTRTTRTRPPTWSALSYRLPVVVSQTAGSTDTFPQGVASLGALAHGRRGDGQHLDVSKLDVANLDALFGSDILNQDGVSD